MKIKRCSFGKKHYYGRGITRGYNCLWCGYRRKQKAEE